MLKFLKKLFHRHVWFEWNETHHFNNKIYTIPNRRCIECYRHEYLESVQSEITAGYLVEIGGEWKQC
jgi:hypothetical protein